MDVFSEEMKQNSKEIDVRESFLDILAECLAREFVRELDHARISGKDVEILPHHVARRRNSTTKTKKWGE